MTTELANIVNESAAIVAVSNAFRNNTVMMNLVSTKDFPADSPSIKFVTGGTLEMTVVAEMADAAIGTYTETSVTVTAQKGVAYTQLSREAQRFGGVRASERNMANEGGKAAGTRFDTDVLALANGFSNSVGATGVNPTAATILEALYKVRLGKVPDTIAIVLHPTSIYDLQTDIITTDKQWINNVPLGILNGQNPANNGLKGEMFGALIYESFAVKSINAGADWAGLAFSPQYAFAAGLQPEFEVEIGKNIRGGYSEIAVRMWYGVAEWMDAAGCLIVADQ